LLRERAFVAWNGMQPMLNRRAIETERRIFSTEAIEPVQSDPSGSTSAYRQRRAGSRGNRPQGTARQQGGASARFQPQHRFKRLLQRGAARVRPESRASANGPELWICEDLGAARPAQLRL
jgi:hypothetical protein